MALLTVRAQLKNKVISSPNDQAAIVFYGTVSARSSLLSVLFFSISCSRAAY